MHMLSIILGYTVFCSGGFFSSDNHSERISKRIQKQSMDTDGVCRETGNARRWIASRGLSGRRIVGLTSKFACPRMLLGGTGLQCSRLTVQNTLKGRVHRSIMACSSVEQVPRAQQHSRAGRCLPGTSRRPGLPRPVVKTK